MSEWFKEPVLKTGDPKGPWVRIPLSPPYLFEPDLEKYPSGRRGSPAKGVVCDKRSEGSNPSFSATIKDTKIGVLFSWRKKKGGFEYGENCVSNLSVGLKCPVDILSGRSHRRKSLFLRQERLYFNNGYNLFYFFLYRCCRNYC